MPKTGKAKKKKPASNKSKMRGKKDTPTKRSSTRRAY